MTKFLTKVIKSENQVALILLSFKFLVILIEQKPVTTMVINIYDEAFLQKKVLNTFM